MKTIKIFLNRFGLRLFGIVFGIILYCRLDIGGIGTQIKNADPYFFFFSIAAVNTIVVLQAWRGYILLGEEKNKLSFKLYAHLYFVSMAASSLVPGRLGAVAQVPLLHQHGIRMNIGFVNVLYDKLSDLCGFLSMAALFAMIKTSKNLDIQPILLVILSIMSFILIWYMDVIFKAGVKFVRKKIFPRLTWDSRNSGPPLSSKTKLYALLLTLIRLGGSIIVHWASARAAGIIIPISLIGAAAAFGAISTLIPLSVLGVGMREGIFLLLFESSGIPNEQVMTFAFLLLIAYLSTALIGTSIAFLKKEDSVRKI